ncbi:MAG TPA: TolC family protein, partial [Saprospiraceae bacterium]|nr:TolC family protein [Saprospiraceae bacterium]
MLLSWIKMLRKTPLFLLFVLAATVLPAQQLSSPVLDEYIRQGLANNPGVTARNLEWQKSLESIRLAKSLSSPTVQFNASYTRALGGRSIDLPIGDLLFEVGGVRIGFEICEDAWVADRPGIALARHGVDVLLNPSASHFAFGKLDVRKRFVVEGSRAFSASYVYANLLGNESGRTIFDGGA